jgi:hypothetical protein
LRRTTALALAVALVVLAAPARAKKDENAADAVFLLTELPKRARELLAAKGIDWPKVTKDLRAEAKRIDDDVAFVRWTERLVACLRDGHAGITQLAPDLEAKVKAAWDGEAKGRRWTGPRVHLVVAGKEVLVGEAFGEAAEMGVRVGMKVLTVDDVPARAWMEKKAAEMRAKQGYSTDHAALHAAGHWGLADWEGTPVSFHLLAGSDRKNVTITRNGGPNFAPSGPVIPPEPLQSVGRQRYGKTASGFGYVHLRDVPDDLPRQIDTMLAAIGDVPGLIVDMRANGGGGCDHEAVFGRFVPAGTTWRQYRSQGERPFAGPVVVIVDAGVRSAGETIAGDWKEDGRAYVIGPEPTAGASSQKAEVTVPSGRLTIRVSVASNKGRFNGGRGIVGIGVPPHETVAYDGADLLRGVDSQIRRAEELLAKGFPKGVVPYEPPKR